MDGMSARPLARDSLAAELERVRLAHRARRLREALRALREHANGRGPGAVPASLQRAIADFARELGEIEAKRRALDVNP
jgi:hypothetical protein